MAMASSSLLLLLLLLLLSLSMLVSAGFTPRPRPNPKTGNFFGKAFKKAAKAAVKDYLKQEAQDKIADIYNSQNGGTSGQHLGSEAADQSPALTFNVSIGALAPQSLSVVIDITGELIWTLCACNGADCLGTPETPFFQPPDGSSSFSQVDCATPECQDTISQTCNVNADQDYCRYVQRYMSSNPQERIDTSGYLATERFTFGTTPVDDLVFGCSDSSTVDLAGASGSVGFNRGSLSIVSQLQLSSFSYLISSEQNPNDPSSSKSFIAWSVEEGVPAVQPSSHSRSTPLLPPETTPTPNLYYVKLTGIEVDGQLLQIQPEIFDVQVDGSGSPQSGGVFLSTTTPITYLEKDAYIALRTELVSRIKAQGVNPVRESDPYHLCYMTYDFASKKVPTVTLVFDGLDAKMELDVNNYFFSFPPDNSGGGQECLTILPSIGGSVLGSLLQMDMNMTFNMDDGLLTFDKAEAVMATAAAAAFPMSLTITATPLLLLVCMIFF